MRTLTTLFAAIAWSSLAAFAKEAEPAGAPAHYGPARPQAGLIVRAQVDKPRALPDDVVTYTLVCQNLGPSAESKIVVEARLGDGVEVLPVGTTPGGAYEPNLRRLSWQIPTLAADEQSAFSFRAKLSAVAPGKRIETAVSISSAAMGRPREAQPAATEVVSEPLLAALAIPDVIIAGDAAPKPLIDLGAQPGQTTVERLENLGVVKGYPDGSFRPQTSVTRAEATKMIVAVRQLAGLRDKAGISVALGRPATVRVRIENKDGATVRDLAQDWALPAGQHNVVWDGRDDRGRPLPLGVYRYEVAATDEGGVRQVMDGTIHVVTVRPLPAGLRTSFIDVPRESWFRPYVAKAEQDGIVKGYPDGRFHPNQPIRRVENTVLVVRAAGLSAEAEAHMNAQLGFDDAASVPKWAVGYVAVATTNGATAEGRLLVGYADNRFLPNQNLTRAEAALILERLLDRGRAVDVTASGVIARGHTVTINGRPVTSGDNGRFRQQVPVETDLELLPVEVK